MPRAHVTHISEAPWWPNLVHLTSIFCLRDAGRACERLVDALGVIGAWRLCSWLEGREAQCLVTSWPTCGPTLATRQLPVQMDGRD